MAGLEFGSSLISVGPHPNITEDDVVEMVAQPFGRDERCHVGTHKPTLIEPIPETNRRAVTVTG